jgi:hypothetical protein
MALPTRSENMMCMCGIAILLQELAVVVVLVNGIEIHKIGASGRGSAQPCNKAQVLKIILILSQHDVNCTGRLLLKLMNKH